MQKLHLFLLLSLGAGINSGHAFGFLRCLLQLKPKPPESALRSPTLPKNQYNWAPLLSRIQAQANVKEKFAASLAMYEGTNTKEFRELMDFLDSEAGKAATIQVFDTAGASVADPEKNRVTIYLREREDMANQPSAAHTAIHELTHLKDFSENHPSVMSRTNTDIYENPINQLSRELRANYVAHSSYEKAWQLTESLYPSRVRNIIELVPEFKSLDDRKKYRLLESLTQLAVSEPKVANDLHAYWWKKKYGSSWNFEQANRYQMSPEFNLPALVNRLLAADALVK